MKNNISTAVSTRRRSLLLIFTVALCIVLFYFLSSDSTSFLSISNDESTLVLTTTTRWIAEDDAEIHQHQHQNHHHVSTEFPATTTIATVENSNSHRHHRHESTTSFSSPTPTPPLDYRILGDVPLPASAFPNNGSNNKLFFNMSENGGGAGFRNLIPSKKTWLFVKKREALLWFEKKYPSLSSVSSKSASSSL